MKKAKTTIYAQDALYVTAYLEDFDGDIAKWKVSFYELWRYQMTWYFAHTIELFDSEQHGVFVNIVCKPAFKDSLLNTMESLGYRNVKVQNDEVGFIHITDLPDDMLFDFAVID